MVRRDQEVFAGVDSVASAIHVCRGNNRSRFVGTDPYDAFAASLFPELTVDRVLLEYDDARAGGFDALRLLPDTITAVLGLITTKHGDMEHRDDLHARIEDAARHVPLDRLALSTQCGFASDADGNEIDAERAVGQARARRRHGGGGLGRAGPLTNQGSGCQFGCRSGTRLWVIRRMSRPSARIVYSSKAGPSGSSRPRLACRSLVNAIRRPSGDHTGCVSSAAVRVRRRSPVPSALMTAMSLCRSPPDRPAGARSQPRRRSAARRATSWRC